MEINLFETLWRVFAQNWQYLSIVFLMISIMIVWGFWRRHKLKKKESTFFECLGEIWRDITALEFLMRCAIAKYNKELDRFPKPPYKKGVIYKNPPQSFLPESFTVVRDEFNRCFPELAIPDELIQLRHAMAHGLIVEVNKSGVEEIIKFKKSKDKKGIRVDFVMSLEDNKIDKLRQSLKEIRLSVMNVLH